VQADPLGMLYTGLMNKKEHWATDFEDMYIWLVINEVIWREGFWALLVF